MLPWALVALLPGVASAAMGCRPLSSPQGAQVVVVADDLVINNVPMATWEIRWRESPERLRAYYRNLWETRGGRVVETEAGEWKTVATLDGECFYTVQTKPVATGSYGLIGVTKPPANAVSAPLGTGFPSLSGSRVANDLRHRDGVRNARTVMLANSFSIEANASFYRNAMAGQGWDATQDRAVGAGAASARAMSWKRGAEELVVTIGPSPVGTVVTANFVDRP